MNIAPMAVGSRWARTWAHAGSLGVVMVSLVLPDAASPLGKDGYLVVPTGFGVVSCLEAKTGRVLWERDFDRGFWSSPIAVDDRVYPIDRSGAMQVFKLGEKFELLGVSGIGEGAYATPAFLGDRIYIRGLTHLFCIGATAE
jgi:hypothetical protein